MTKNLVFIHGGDGYDTYEEYLESLKDMPWTTLPYAEKKRWRGALFAKVAGIAHAYLPELPCKQNAKYAEWKIVFDQLAANLPDDTVYIGHSLGANFIAKYLYETGKKAKVIHLVAGCYGLGGGFGLPDTLERLHDQADEIHIWYSMDDKVVDPSHFDRYKVSLPRAKVHVFDDRWHFNMESFPEMEEVVLESLR